MTLGQLTKYAVSCIKERPELEDEIISLCQLAFDEVEEGGSEDHEYGLAERDIMDLVSNQIKS